MVFSAENGGYRLDSVSYPSYGGCQWIFLMGFDFLCMMQTVEREHYYSCPDTDLCPAFVTMLTVLATAYRERHPYSIIAGIIR